MQTSCWKSRKITHANLFLQMDDVRQVYPSQIEIAVALFFLHKWFRENAVLSLSDFATHLAVQVNRGTILMPLILRHPLGCLCLHPPQNTGRYNQIVRRVITAAPHRGSSIHCGRAKRKRPPMNRGRCAATVKICLLLHTVKLYHGKVIKWEAINYTLSWKRDFEGYCFCFQNPQPPIVLHDITVSFLYRTCLWC